MQSQKGRSREKEGFYSVRTKIILLLRFLVIHLLGTFVLAPVGYVSIDEVT